MKIYTKTGDLGTTALIGGKRVPKNNIRIEAYGTVDELIAHMGYLRDQDMKDNHKRFLMNVQSDLMSISAILASDDNNQEAQLPKVDTKNVAVIENEIDKLENNLPALKAFIIPGGHLSVSVCHIVRTVCRRAERRVYSLQEKHMVPEIVSVYLNRLSDYLFVLGRTLSNEHNVNENIWNEVLEK